MFNYGCNNPSLIYIIRYVEEETKAMLTATILVITGHFTPVATTFFTSKIELLPFVIVSSNVPTTLQQDATVKY